MISQEVDEEMTEKYSTVTQQNPDMDDKLADLSCPFTWEMEGVVEIQNKLMDAEKNRFESVVDIQDNFPEFELVYHLMLAYENVVGNDLESAMQSINNAEQNLADITQKAALKNAEDVLQHIFVATKCHVLHKLQRETEVDELLEEILYIYDMNEVELAMLSGCQCLGFLLYCATDNRKAVESAEKAIECDPDNGKCKLQCLRNVGNKPFINAAPSRKPSLIQNCIRQQPASTQLETSAFEKAFKLSRNVLFGITLARLYRDSLNYKKANKLYQKVYDLKPTSCKVQLELAFRFIRAKQSKLAKNCLDYVAEHMPNSMMYTHYMAIYEEECNNDLKAALRLYKDTTEKGNFVAEWRYIKCRKQVEPEWDPFPYMKDLTRKYDDDRSQEINVKIGLCYLFEKRDILSACITLTQAIKISPTDKLLKDHEVLFRGFRVNVYHVLEKEIKFELQNMTALHDSDTILILKETLALCRKYCRNLPKTSEFSLAEAPNSVLRNSSRNYNVRSFDPIVINAVTKRPATLSQGLLTNHPSLDSRRIKYHSTNTSTGSKDLASTDHVRGGDIKGRLIRQSYLPLKSPDKDCEDLALSSMAKPQSSESSTRWRYDIQGNSSRARFNVVGERSNPSSQDIRKNYPQRFARIRSTPRWPVESTASSKTKQKKNDSSEAYASCCLVKTVKNLNL